MKIAPLAPVLLALAVGCSNSQDASEGNFKAAIDKVLPELNMFMAGKKPRCINMSKVGAMGDGKTNGLLLKVTYLSQHDQSMLSALEKAEIISKRNRGIEQVYFVSEDAIKNYSTIKPDQTNQYSFIRFCVGDVAVDRVTGWTVPADLNGKKTTEVKYKIKLVNPPAWAKNLIKEYDLSEEKKMTFILTNQGWSVDDALLQRYKFNL